MADDIGETNGAAPQPEDDPPLTQEEFMEAMKDPANVRSLEHFYRQTIGGEFGELTPEAIDTVRKALNAHTTMQKTKLVMEKMQELVSLMERPGGTMIAEERLAQLNQLVDEITDAELELPEPYRTNLMQQFVPLRAQIKALRIE